MTPCHHPETPPGSQAGLIVRNVKRVLVYIAHVHYYVTLFALEIASSDSSGKLRSGSLS